MSHVRNAVMTRNHVPAHQLIVVTAVYVQINLAAMNCVAGMNVKFPKNLTIQTRIILIANRSSRVNQMTNAIAQW